MGGASSHPRLIHVRETWRVVRLRSFILGVLIVLFGLGVVAGVRALTEPPATEVIGPRVEVESGPPPKPDRAHFEKIATEPSPEPEGPLEPSPILTRAPVEAPPKPPLSSDDDEWDDD